MAGTEHIDFLEKEITSKSLKTHLDEWKEIIVILNLIMKCDEIWFPVIIVICVTSFYLYIWLINYSILNIIWMIGLCATLIDCLVCGPVQKILPLNSWDQEKEYIFTTITDSITNFWDIFILYIGRLIQLRLTNKLLFHSVLTVSFFSLLYIGTIFNNLFISYITVLVILLFPRIKIKSEHIKNVLKSYTHMIMSYLWSIKDQLATT